MPDEIRYRRFTADDAEGVFSAACESWHATYANILPRQFIDGFLATHYGPEKLRTFSRPTARGGRISVARETMGGAEDSALTGISTLL